MAGLNLRKAAPVLLAALGGAAAGLAHPGFGLLPGLLGFALILRQLDTADPDRRMRSAFLRGWAAGFAYFLVATWWVGEAFLVDAAAHAWQAPFAVALLPAGLGLFWGAAGALYRRFAPPHLGRILFFAAILSGAEWLRGHVLTGFPWDLPGAAWRAGSAISQTAAVVGVYGLTFLTLAIAASAVTLFPGHDRRSRIAAIGPAILVLATLSYGGAWRLSQPAPADAPQRIRVVQANVPQTERMSAGNLAPILQRHLRLSALPAKGGAPDIIVWPEGAVPASANEILAPDLGPRAEIARVLTPNQTLMFGTYRVEGTRSRPVYFNSLVAVRRNAEGLALTGLYDKYRLVPFGEYLPLESLMGAIGVKKLVAVGDGFTSGPEPRPIVPVGVPPVQPLICYESLFPGFVRDGPDRPKWIVNVSNDSWFGQTSGPWQHLNLASYRAIESGLPLIRATPTGVSAIVDALGRPRRVLGLGVEGVIDGPLPGAATPTLYARLGDVPLGLLFLAGLACGWHQRRKR